MSAFGTKRTCAGALIGARFQSVLHLGLLKNTVQGTENGTQQLGICHDVCDRHRWLFIGPSYRVVPASEAGRLTNLLAHRLRRPMSASGGKADMGLCAAHVRF